MQLVSIELTKVYRQQDPVFINILDHIRTSEIYSKDLDLLNQRVNAELNEDDNKLSITLSTRRDTVDYINEKNYRILKVNPCSSKDIQKENFH